MTKNSTQIVFVLFRNRILNFRILNSGTLKFGILMFRILNLEFGSKV